MARPHGPRQRIKRPLEDRFARAPILTRYTPLIMDEDIKAPKAPMPEVKEVIVTVEEPVVQQQYNNDNNNNNNINKLQQASVHIPLDHGWSGYELETVDLEEGYEETTTAVPVLKDLIEIKVPEVEVVKMDEMAVALGQAGAVQLNWGSSMRKAVANGLQKISLEHPAVEEGTSYLSFPPRLQTGDLVEPSPAEVNLGSNTKEEVIRVEYVPKEAETSWQAVDTGKNKVEMFRGVVIEDNSDLEVEQPKIAPPYHHQVNASIIVSESSIFSSNIFKYMKKKLIYI